MTATSRTISDECSVIAFYGIQPSPKAAESSYHTLVSWFKDLGCPPDKLATKEPGRSGRLVPFPRGNAKLLRTGFERVSVFELVSTNSNALQWNRDYSLIASYDGRPKQLSADIVARSSLATLSATSMLPIAQVMAEQLRPAYGIGYRMEHRLGPEFYVDGIGYGTEVLSGAAYDEACNVARWGDLGMVKQVYRQGIIRDVYPWNFLTRPQLSRLIDQVTLEDWIRQDPRRGILIPLCDEVMLWEVAMRDLSKVRLALQQAQIVFHWQTHLNNPE
jgi:hypothetical protein